ncbi:MAG: NAD(P)H-dependent oxidoreductase [Bacteroidales bacterium]|nr:NAD(P)H-dependent oxidoreductase [Bacteroidales bacterium]MCF8404093.1 NAD(P)H-dependent oxidoreductase [Bacteroidales bacterium]
MKLTVINGSPKGKRSNTKLLTDAFLNGYHKTFGNQSKEYFLSDKKLDAELQRDFIHAESLLIAFPLYTDSMPGMVKEYFESLENYKSSNPGIKIGFLVQSGFPESYHSFFVARYLKKFATLFDSDYLGTIIKGGVEGIQMKPAWMRRKTLKRFEKLGFMFGKYGRFDQSIIKKLSTPVKLGRFALGFFKFAKIIKLGNFYWDYQLKSNNAYEKRFDKHSI